MPKFSIIIPTYNRSAALKRCLESLVAQTYKNFEVIVCDDGSSDNSAQIVDQFVNKLDIKYIFQENWGGPARPRNNGIALAKAEYVCFLDSDDWWMSTKMEKLDNFVSENYDVYYHTLSITNGQLTFGNIRCRKIDNSDPGLDLLINLNTVPTSAVCVRLSFLKKANGFSEQKELIAVEDYDLWIRLGFLGAKFYLIDEALGCYYIEGKDSITLTDERQVKKYEALYDQYLTQQELSNNKILGALFFHIGRIRQDGKLGNWLRNYLKSFWYGSFRVKLMSLNRLIRFSK